MAVLWQFRSRRGLLNEFFGQGPSSADSVRGFVQAPGFWLPAQLSQIQPFTGCTCTKGVPFRCRFDEKPP
jgi:hypothetical protein